MRTFGTAELKDGTWLIRCEPHVALRLKRTFGRLNSKSFGVLTLTDTIETARELQWFCERFPLAVNPRDYLDRRADAHREQEAMVARIMGGEFTARPFDLAVPAREYQKVAADLVLRTGGLLLADDVGIGKTASAICMLTEPATRPALVVTLAHLPRQWKDELQKFAPSLRAHIAKKGTPYPLEGKQGTLFGEFPDVIIMNYHKLPGWAETLAPRIRSVVFDEVQELRHRDTVRYAAAQHLVKAASFRLGLSATPIYNYGGEMWSVMEALRPGALGTWGEFATEWCTASFGDKPRIQHPKAFGTYTREHGLMLRRTRKDVGRELPELSKIEHYVDADTAALDKVADAATELARIILDQNPMARGEKWKASEELSYLVRQATGIAKAPYVADFVRLLIESGEKVVLYGWHREVYSIWLSRLKDLKPVMYTGTESTTQKHESRRRFIAGESPLLVMSLRAGAGLDGLQGACRTVVFGELDWSPGVHEQAIGRVHRDGQGDPVAAYFLVADSGSDPVIADTLGVKRSQIEGIRDPDAALVEKLQQSGEDNVKRLARALLEQRGDRSERKAESA